MPPRARRRRAASKLLCMLAVERVPTAPSAMPRSRGILAVLTLSLGLGCSDLSKFELEAGEAYCGSLVSAPLFHAGFVPDGSPPRLRLRLQLDIDRLTSRPGELTSDDQGRGLCRDTDERLFDEAELRAIPEVLHDPISTLDFGEGRKHSFFAYVDSSCQGTMLAITSLMKNGDVEMRLFKPRPATGDDAPASESAGYALFYLKRRDQDKCGF